MSRRRVRGPILTDYARESLRNIAWVVLGAAVIGLAVRALRAFPFLMGA